MFGLGMTELMIIGVIAVMLFGKRLPEVARSVGASYSEFRKGLTNIQSDFNAVSDAVSDSYSSAGTSTSAVSDCHSICTRRLSSVARQASHALSTISRSARRSNPPPRAKRMRSIRTGSRGPRPLAGSLRGGAPQVL